MNYFELFDMPVSLQVIKAGLSKKYFELQKKYHPDYFANASAQEKEDTLDISSQINKAYKAFQNKEETIKYVLQLKGLIEDEEKYSLPPIFLMEVMELNEMKMDDTLDAGEINRKALELQKESFAPVASIVENYAEGITTTNELLKVKEYYYKKKYIDRLLAE